MIPDHGCGKRVMHVQVLEMACAAAAAFDVWQWLHVNLYLMTDINITVTALTVQQAELCQRVW